MRRPGIAARVAGGRDMLLRPADAEVTFFLKPGEMPRGLRVTVRPSGVAAMHVVLNANLVSYGDKGTLVGTAELTERDWTVRSFDLDAAALRPGLNSIAFVFDGSTAASPGAFDKIEFLTTSEASR